MPTSRDYTSRNQERIARKIKRMINAYPEDTYTYFLDMLVYNPWIESEGYIELDQELHFICFTKASKIDWDWLKGKPENIFLRVHDFEAWPILKKLHPYALQQLAHHTTELVKEAVANEKE